MDILNAVYFEEAISQVGTILTTQSADEIADRLETICNVPDLALAVMMLLVFKAKDIDYSDVNGVQLANVQPTFADLIIPSGVKP